MKGTFFQKPLEFRVSIEGETWRQGDRIAGTLVVRNPGPEPVPLSEVRIILADGLEKKVKAKSADAFTPLQSVNPVGTDEVIAPGKSSSPLPWEFVLDANARITDNAGSLYLLYGRGAEETALGQLRLPILPQIHFEDLIGVMETHFRFVTKQKKAAKKGGVDFKLTPPSGTAVNSLDFVVLSLRMEGQDLVAKFDFQVKGIDAASGTLTVKKSRKISELRFAPAEYLHSFNGRLNREAMEKAIEPLLEEVKSGSLPF